MASGAETGLISPGSNFSDGVICRSGVAISSFDET